MRAFVLLLLAGACDPDRQEALEDLERLETAMEGYASWEPHAEWTGILESLDGTHGSHVQIWFDEAFLATVAAGGGAEMPAGAVAVKEGYDDGAGMELNHTVAHLRKDDGSLFFAVWDEDGELENFGRPELCTDCHVLGQDEVMALTW